MIEEELLDFVDFVVRGNLVGDVLALEFALDAGIHDGRHPVDLQILLLRLQVYRRNSGLKRGGGGKEKKRGGKTKKREREGSKMLVKKSK